mmetsp:Transcript_20721/g.31978  ORF Transcript_20721/g.31978 Transcript_20721/m.31978 type:complete len:116 (+) Transcript_20721:112-459(+)
MEYTTVVLPVAVTAAAETPDDVRGENALAVVLPVAAAAVAANLATAFVVSAVASASETTTDTTQVHKYVGGDDSIGVQLFKTVHQNQHQQGALESIMASTRVSLERATCNMHRVT